MERPMNPQHGAGVEGPHCKDQNIAEQGGDGRAHRAAERNQKKIPRQIAGGAKHGCDKGGCAALFHHIDGGQKGAQAGEGGGQSEHRHIPPRLIVLRSRQQAGGQPRREDDPGGGHKGDGRIDGIHIGEKTLLFHLRLLRQRGELPCGRENAGDIHQNIGNFVGHRVNAGGGAADQQGDQIPVRDVDDPAAKGAGHQRRAVPEHPSGFRPGEGRQTQVSPLFRGRKHKYRGNSVGQYVGQHIAGGPHREDRQQQNIKQDCQNRAEDAVQRKETDMAQRACELVADRVEVGRQHIEQNQPHISGEKRQLVQEGGGQGQNEEAGQRHQDTGGKNAGLVGAALQPVSDHSVGDSDGGNGGDQVSGLDQQVGDSVFGAGEDAGVERGEQKGKKPGAECADAKQNGVGDQIPVEIQRFSLPGAACRQVYAGRFPQIALCYLRFLNHG